MSLLPLSTTRHIVESELDAIYSWAQRKGWEVTVDLDDLVLVATATHPADDGLVRVAADLDGYKAVPPAWRITNPDGDPATPGDWPSGGSFAGGSLIFHSNQIICAPFNRLAYETEDNEDGLHSNWGEPTDWLDVKGAEVRATDLASMLQVIKTHLHHSPGRMG